MTNKRLVAKKCCVYNCNSKSTSENINLYHFPTDNKLFPHKVARRNAWVEAVRLNNANGSEWKPTKSSLICNLHFAGLKKSEHPLNPGYNPTIFPPIYKKIVTNPQKACERFDRWKKRSEVRQESGKKNFTIPNEEVDLQEISSSINDFDGDDLFEEEIELETVKSKNVQTQVDFLFNKKEKEVEEDILLPAFICSRMPSYNNQINKRDAETYIAAPNSSIKKCQLNELPIKSDIGGFNQG
ncbi:hypothetical protein TKK_0013788 [Trichogramma kaykai]|uniref:THAP-type domain-containing protein n=1 Tax=Trichogramma kaykai TaxID=54128 RepID=A0ABD2WHX4_9HYME